jgi:putative tryptophan/tyrosine transport system substrate-binding protein
MATLFVRAREYRVPKSVMLCQRSLAGAETMRRREFVALVGGGVAAWALAARAQQSERIRKIGVPMNLSSEDPEGQARVKAYAQALQKLGWIEGGNVRTEIRWAANDPNRYRRYSEELVALAPDVILAASSASVAALQRVTHSVPIVFVNVIDPVGAGFVNSMARPGGNATGFTAFEYSLSGKWLEVLKEIAPNLTRVAVLRNPSIAAGIGQFAAIQTMAASSGVELSVIDPTDTSGIGRAFAAFAHQPNGGVIVTGSTSTAVHRELIISLLMQYISLGPDTTVRTGASPPMGLIRSRVTHAPLVTSIAFSKARCRLTCRCRRRPSISLSSI